MGEDPQKHQAIARSEDQIARILALSYDDLPYYLKPCFLYLGAFPEDSEIPARRLVRLWVAEGFAHPRGEITMEEVAEDYLDELIQRSLVQMTKRSASGGIKAIRVHELVRRSSSSFERTPILLFHQLEHDGSRSMILRLEGTCIIFESSFFIALRFESEISNLRFPSPIILKLHSLLRSSGRIRIIDILKLHSLLRSSGRIRMKFLLHNFKLLRVIDLVNTSIPNLPSKFGESIHLRYLGLKHTGLRMLPSSICNLVNLQTLDIRHNKVKATRSLTSTIWKLQHLRHFYGDSLVIASLKVSLCKNGFKRNGSTWSNK